MKILIISHNPLCTYNAMGKTLASMFSCFCKDELCQLYIYPSYPDLDLCSSYFRITDKDVLRSLACFSRPGNEIDKGRISSGIKPFESKRDEQFYRSAKNKSSVRRIARDTMWRVSRWYGRELRTWLEQEHPDLIFAAPGNACFLYDLAIKISKRRGIPIVSYICDEYFFVKQGRTLAERFQQRLLKNKIETFLKSAAFLFTISEELKSAYEAYFSIPAAVLMTGSTITASSDSAAEQQADTISYFGNIRSGRYVSLRQIGDALDSYNSVCAQKHYLDVYSFEHDPDILKYLGKPASVRIHDFIQGKEFEEVFLSSKLLAHVESFDEAQIDRVKHSVSTKIADSLASGIPLFAYGPAGLSSIKHLRRNACAFVCTDPAQLSETLQYAMNDLATRKSIVQRARETAALFHDSASNSRILYRKLLQICGDKHESRPS